MLFFHFNSGLIFKVQSAPHEKHGSLPRWAQNSEDKVTYPQYNLPTHHYVSGVYLYVIHCIFFSQDYEFLKSNDPILPTFFPFEASSPEPLDEDVSKETSNGGDGTDEVYSLDLEAFDGRSTPVLLSEEMLIRLIKASEYEQRDVEKDEEDGDEDAIENVADTNVESAEITLETKNDRDEKQPQRQQEGLEEEQVGSTTDSEIPVDLDYAADGVSAGTQQMEEKNRPLTGVFGEKEKVNDELPTVMEDYDTQHNRDYEDPMNEQRGESARAMSTETLREERILPGPKTKTGNTDKDKEGKKTFSEDEEGQEDRNKSISHIKETPETQMESRSLKKRQSDRALRAGVTSKHSQDQEPEKEAETEPTVEQKKRGKWVRPSAQFDPKVRLHVVECRSIP